MKLTPVDKLRPGDLIAGTWTHTWPTPRRLEHITPSPEDSVTGPAYRLDWSDGTSQVLYGTCEVQLAQRP